MSIEELAAEADKRRARWQERGVVPPTEAQARLLRDTFNPIRLRVPERKAA